MVTVNGEVVDTLPAWVDPDDDRIVAEGRVVGKTKRRNIYVMLFKPRGTVSTNKDPEGRCRAIDLVRHPSRPPCRSQLHEKNLHCSQLRT